MGPRTVLEVTPLGRSGRDESAGREEPAGDATRVERVLMNPVNPKLSIAGQAMRLAALMTMATDRRTVLPASKRELDRTLISVRPYSATDIQTRCQGK